MQGNVLEGEGGAMEQLKNVRRIRELLEWSDVWVAEGAVGFFDEGAELILGNLLWGDVKG